MTWIFIFLKNNINLESLVIAVSGYLIVFAALVILFWFFSTVPKLIKLVKSKSKVVGFSRNHKEAEMISGEATAAIAMALHLYLDEMHDIESGVLTIKKISNNYSPWSSKIYAVRNQFNRL